MAPRKPLTSVLKRDPGFAATLSLGPQKLTGPVDASQGSAEAPPAPPAAEPHVDGKPSSPSRKPAKPDRTAQRGEPSAAKARAEKICSPAPSAGPPTAARSQGRSPGPGKTGEPGVKLSIAVSIAEADVAAVEAFAARALVTPQQLLRKIAQRAKHEIIGDWLETGFVREEETETRGKLTTSVSVTIPQSLATRIAETHDPMGLMGVARIVAPTYRNAFNRALRRALKDAGV